MVRENDSYLGVAVTDVSANPTTGDKDTVGRCLQYATGSQQRSFNSHRLTYEALVMSVHANSILDTLSNFRDQLTTDYESAWRLLKPMALPRRLTGLKILQSGVTTPANGSGIYLQDELNTVDALVFRIFFTQIELNAMVATIYQHREQWHHYAGNHCSFGRVWYSHYGAAKRQYYFQDASASRQQVATALPWLYPKDFIVLRKPDWPAISGNA